MTIIRKEQSDDEAAIRVVHTRAFGGTVEADIVDKLRVSCPDLVSLVALSEDDEIEGHILFSPVRIDDPETGVQGMGLGPVAVLPELQRQGIGSDLTRAGLISLTQLSCPFVVVLGHPEFYERFGFVPASEIDIQCQWEGVPDEVFRILVIQGPVLSDARGTAFYRPEFSEVM